jgi:argininosuccinate lyase
MKMWAGRTEAVTDERADEFNSSISFDSRMYPEDIDGSIAHARMLGKTGILKEEDVEAIVTGLEGIRTDLDSGKLKIDPSAEDIHMFIEQELTRRIGDAGKKVHTARSRNDQVASDLHLYLKKENRQVFQQLKELVQVLLDQAEANKAVIMPGYTHLQRAQPIVFGHHLSAYIMMFLRDMDRLNDTYKRTDVSVIGSCALAGTTYPTDREYEAQLLGFSAVSMNSMDGVSDRDFVIELLSDLAMVMMHLSRLSEEIVLWTSWEFHFVELDDAYTTGSSIMPQKKNSDMAELARGKTGRVYGDLMALLTTMKGLPLAYNKDMQEDKQPVFDALDQVKMCLSVMTPMIATMKVLPENMLQAARKGFINATDLADYLTRKGMPFRDAYKTAGRIVHYCLSKDCVLEDVTLEEYRTYSDLFEEDVYEAINLTTCVNQRTSLGGTAVSQVEKEIAWSRKKLEELTDEESVH